MKCKLCGFPDTRPGLIFENGICLACINFAKRKEIDWKERERELAAICDKYRGHKPYDCLIPVSGGKDSHRLVHIMKEEMGMNPLLVTVSDSFTHTQAGLHNIRNLITRYNCNHWQYTISHDLFIRATRAAFEGTGEAMKFVEYAIYTVPFMLAQKLGIGLLVFGENSAYEYGSEKEDLPDAGNRHIKAMSRKIIDEAGWWYEKDIPWHELHSILPEFNFISTEIRFTYPQMIYMSRYRPWSSVVNLEVAKANGFKTLDDFKNPDGTREWDRKGSFEFFEQIDSIGYWTHLQMKILKFGFGRTTDLACRRLREGLISKEECDMLITEHDHVFDPQGIDDFCRVMNYTAKEFWEIANKLTKRALC